MKRVFLCLFLLLCIMSAAVTAQAAETDWYVDEATKTLYINGHGSTADIKPDGWKAEFNIHHVVIGEGITAIADEAFSGCLYLETVQLPASLTQIGARAFQNTGLTEIVIPKGVKVIDERVFYQCGSLTKVELHDGITNIGYEAFRKCRSLKKLDIPGSVQGIGTNAFADCSGLEEVRFQNGMTRLPGDEFNQCTSLRYLEIPDTVESLRYVYFTYLPALETVRIGSGLKQLFDETFDGCTNLKHFEISPDNQNFCSVDGVIYSKDQTTLIRLPLGYEGTYEVVPGTLTIGARAADGCVKLTGLTVPDSVTSIDDYAFRDCESLETVTLGKGVTELDQGAFCYCKKLKNLVLNEGLVTIGNSAFGWCESLESLTIPSTVTMIADHAFSRCTGVKRIDFLGNKPILWDPFDAVRAEAYHPEGNATWKSGWLNYGGYLIWPQDPSYKKYEGTCGTNLIWKLNPDTGVLTISGQGAMGDFSNNYVPIVPLIKSVILEEGILSIPRGWRIEGCTELVIPASVRQIEEKAVQWPDLERLEIRGNGVAMGYMAFSGCAALKTIRFTGDAPQLEPLALYGTSATIYYPEGNDTWTQELMDTVMRESESVFKAYEPKEETPLQEVMGGENGAWLIWLIPVGAVVLAGAVMLAALLIKKRK